MRESSHPGQPQCSRYNKNEGIRPANSTQKNLSFTSFSLLFSTKLIWQQKDLPGLMHFLAQHVQGHVTAQCHLCQLPILQEKRDLVTGAHAVRQRATKLRLHSPTLDSLGDPSSTRHPNRGLEIHPSLFLLPQLCARRGAHTLLENISGEEGSTDVSIEKGTKGLTDLLRC